MAHHIVPLKTNFITLIALIILTVLTVLTAKYVHIGDMNLVLAMFIASVKVSIVLGWFMHLKYDGLMNRVIALTAIFFLLLFVGFAYIDLFFR